MLSSADQIVSKFGGMLLLLLGFITEMLGKAGQLTLSKPDSSSEVISS